jgi:hypothetical protein
MKPRRRGIRLGFALFGVLAVLAFFVLDGPVAGVVAFAAMLVFIVACIRALSNEDADDRAKSDRVGLAGWIGGWF